MSNVTITSVKKKKRVRSIFSDKQIERRGADSSESEEGQGMLNHPQESLPLPDTTYRFEVDLQALTKGDQYPEIYFSDLITAQEEAEKSPELGEEDSEMARLAAHFESKYGEKKKKKRVTDIQLDHGYDTSDAFIDDSEAFDEVIPDELDTQLGGFYINSGDLMFKKVETVISDAEDQEAESKTKKRKRDEEEDHDKQRSTHDEKKIKKAKIKSLKHKLKNMNIKKPKVHRVIDDDSDESESDNVQSDNVQSVQSADHSQPTSCSVSDLETTNKERPSKEKEASKEKVLKRSTKVKSKMPQLIEQFKKIIADNAPFDKTKVHLLHGNMYALEVDVRTHRKQTGGKKLLYETLSTHAPAIDQKDLRILGNSAFNKQCKEMQEKREVPLKAAIDAAMPTHIAHYTIAKTEYDNRLAALPPDEHDELVKPKAPSRTFTWTEGIRALYGAVVTTKFESLKLLREKASEQEDLMKSYLDKLAETLWPVAWMSKDALIKEATPYCALFNKNPKKGINKAPSVKTMPKSKPSISSKLLKNAITKQAAKQDQQTSQPKKIPLQPVATPAAQSKPSIIKQHSTPDPSAKFLPNTNVQTTANPNLKAPAKTPNPSTTNTQQQLTNKLVNFVGTKPYLASPAAKPAPLATKPAPLATKPNNISKIITAPSTKTPTNKPPTQPSKPPTQPKAKPLSLKKALDAPKTTSTIVNNKPTPTIANNKMQPVLQLSQAKPQPSSKKLDNTAAEMAQAVRHIKQVIKDQVPDVYNTLQSMPQEEAEGHYKRIVMNQIEQNKLSVSTAPVSKGGTSSSTGTTSSPIVIDDEPSNTTPATTIVAQKPAPSPKPTSSTPSVQKATPLPVPFPSLIKTTPSPKQTQSPKLTPPVSRITPVSVKPAPIRTTPATSKPPGSLLQKVNPSKSFNIHSIMSNPNNKLLTVVSRPNNTFQGLNNTATTPASALSSRPLSAILGDHSDMNSHNSTGVPLKPLKSLTDSLKKFNYKAQADKTL